MKRMTMALAMLALIAGAPALARNEMMGEKVAKPGKPVDYDPAAAMPAGQIWVNYPEDAKGLKKVAVPFFQIQFVTKVDASASNSRDLNVSSVDMHVKLSGPTSQQMQAITDRVYAAFLDQMKAAGIEVVPVSAYAASPSFQKLLSEGRPSGTLVDGMKGYDSLFFVPAGLPLYAMTTARPELTGFGSFIGMSSKGMVERKLQQDAGVPLLGVRMVVDFAQASARKGIGTWSKAKSSAAIAIRPVSTQLWMLPASYSGDYTPTARVRYEVANTLVLQSAAITEMRDSTTSGDKIGNGLTNALGVLSAFSGHGGMGASTKRYDVICDPVVWEKDIGAALTNVSAGLVSSYAASAA